MMRFAALTLVTVVLAAAFTYQMTSLWTLWWTPTVAEPLATQAGGDTRVLSAQRPQAITHAALDAYQHTLSRPIFVEGRRPPAAKPLVVAQPTIQPPAQPPVSLDRYRLLGVHLDDTARRALIETPAGGRAWIGQGERLDDWTLTKIEPDRAHLSTQDRSGELRLYPASQGG